MKQKKRIIITCIIAFCIFGIFWKFHHRIHSPIPDAVLVETYHLTPQTIIQKAEAVGALVAAKQVVISSEVSGVVKEVLFQDGMFVKAGAPLIQLDNTLAAIKVDSAKNDLTLAASNYHRMLILENKDIISHQEMERNLADYQQKKSILAEANANLAKMLLRAPFDGVLGQAKLSPGRAVSVGQELVSLTDTDHLRVEYKLPEKYFALIQKDQEITLSTSNISHKSFKGKVAYVAPTINTEDRTVSLYADIEPGHVGLAPGLFVHVTQELGVQKDALLVPSLSLQATIDGQQVYKIIEGHAHAVLVSVGQLVDDKTQILSGLSPGDEVVSIGQFKLKEGMPVQAKV